MQQQQQSQPSKGLPLTTANKPKPKKTFSFGHRILNFMATPLSPTNPDPGGNCSCTCKACSSCVARANSAQHSFSGFGVGNGYNPLVLPPCPTMADLDGSCLDVYGLRYLLSLDRFAKQDDFRESLQLHTHLLGIALTARHYQSLDIAYAHLHDLFKNEQRAEFAIAYNHLQDTQDAILDYALGAPQSKPSFIDYISFKSSKTVLEFISFVRQNPDVVANAFQSMTPQDLDALLATEKVTFNSGCNRQDLLGNLPSINKLDIVDLLMNVVFGPASFPIEERLRLNLWIEVFVRLLTEKKGERFLLDVLDRYVHLSPWTPRHTFEIQLMKILQRGDILFESTTEEQIAKDASSYSSFSLPFFGVLGGNGNAAAPPKSSAISSPLPPIFDQANQEIALQMLEKQPENKTDFDVFLDQACVKLLQVLDREDIIPAHVLSLSRAILKQVPQEVQHHATIFLIVQWFFHRFLGRAIIYPEHYGMFEEYYISEEQRQCILFMIHQRLYCYVTKIIADCERKPVDVDTEVRTLVERIVTRFSEETSIPECREQSPLSAPQMATPTLKSAAGNAYPSISQYPPTITPTLLLCPSDLITLFYFLCPRYRPQRLQRPNASPRNSKWNIGNGYSSRTSSPRPLSILSLAFEEKTSSLVFPTSSDTSSVSSASSAESPVVDRQTTSGLYQSNGLNINDAESRYRHYRSRSMSSCVEEEPPLAQIFEDMKSCIDEIISHTSFGSQQSHKVRPISEPWALVYVTRDGKDVLMSDPSIAVSTIQNSPTAPIARGNLGPSMDVIFEDEDGLLTEEVRTIGRALFRILREYDFVGDNPDIEIDESTDYNLKEETLKSEPGRDLNEAASTTGQGQQKNSSRSTITISSLLSKAVQTAQAHKDYAAALSYHQALTLLPYQPAQLTHNNAAGLIALLAKPLHRARLRRYERHQKRRHWALYAHDAHLLLVECLSKRREMISSFRLRMWYVSEIRTSKILEKSRIVLNEIVPPSKNPSHSSKSHMKTNTNNNTSPTRKHHHHHHRRHHLKGAAGHLKPAAKKFELDWPPPLSEHHSEVVSRWLHDTGVHNFLPGEERFHRYCIEIDAIRTSVMENMLWTSDLFRKEAMAFKMGYFVDREGRDKNKRFSGLHYQLFNNNYQRQRNDKQVEIRRQTSLSDVFATGKRERRSSASTVGSMPTNTSGFGGGTLVGNRPRRGSSSSSIGICSANLFNVVEGKSIDPIYSTDDKEPTNLEFNALNEQLVSNGIFDDIVPSYELYNPPIPLPPSFLIGMKNGTGPDNDLGKSSMSTSAMDEFTLQTQLKLTGLLLSEFGKGWYDGCETDRWFEEFVNDISPPKEINAMTDTDKNIIGVEYKPEGIDIGGKTNGGTVEESKTIPLNITTDLLDIIAEDKGEMIAENSISSIPASQITISETVSAEVQLAEAQERSPYIPPVQSGNSENIPALSFDQNVHPTAEYPLTECCRSLVEEFTLKPSPYQKLRILFAIEMLAVASLSFAPPLPRSSPAPSTQTSAPLSPALIATSLNSTTTTTPGTDSIINELERLFRQSGIRPKGLFRDMQLVATFVPGTILDLRDEGKAFWDMTLAMSSIKKEVVEVVVERGVSIMDGRITQRDNNMRMAAEKEGGLDEIIIGDDEEEVSKAQMEAIRLFTIGAKESNPTAQRELAILYLSLPTLPLASLPPPSIRYQSTPKSKRQSTQSLFESLGNLSSSTPSPSTAFSTKNLTSNDSFSPNDAQKCNPSNVAAAIHWFERAANAGDKFSVKWLNHRDGKRVAEGILGKNGANFFIGDDEDEDDEG